MFLIRNEEKTIYYPLNRSNHSRTTVSCTREETPEFRLLINCISFITSDHFLSGSNSFLKVRQVRHLKNMQLSSGKAKQFSKTIGSLLASMF